MYKYCSLCGAALKMKKDNLICEKCGFVNYRSPRPTASALLIYRNKLLLVKRAETPFKGWWDLPGGFIDRGESPENAVCRELKEETGLNISIKKLFGIYPGTYPSLFEPFHILSIVYIVRGSAKSLKTSNEVSEGKWFSKKEIPQKIAFDSNQKIIKDFLKIWK